MATIKAEEKTVWTPHAGPQTAALESLAFEVCYGGARGGGKTAAGFAWLLYDIEDSRLRALIIRKTADDLSDWIDRAKQFYAKIKGLELEVVGRPAELRFNTGALFRTGHLRDDNAYEKYQGHEYHRILVEELTQIPSEERYLKLISSCRSPHSDLMPQVFTTTNPGGPGHSWVKQRFIDVSPPMVPYLDPETHRERIFIPAKVQDNPALMANDPAYMSFLNGLPEPLRSAWRDGNWDIFVGQYFKHWDRRIHVVEPFEIPQHWKRYRAVDYGSQAPAAVTWWAVNEGNKAFCYRELYATDLTYEELAAKMKAMTPANELIEYTVADPSIVTKREQDGRTFYTGAELMGRAGVYVVGGDNRRIEGWRRMQALMKYGQIAWFSTCLKSIETLPALIHDINNPEDVDCFIAGTKVSTATGPKNVEDVKCGDLVHTPIGLRPVIKSGISGYSDTCVVTFSDGRRLEGTPDHKVYVCEKGLIQLKDLAYNDTLIGRNIVCERPLCSTALPLQDGKAADTGSLMARSCHEDIPTENRRAEIVDWYLKQGIRPRQHVLKRVLEKLVGMLDNHAPSVAKNLWLRRTATRLLKPVHITAVGYSAERKPVYNLTVDEAHLFYANGFLVTNTDCDDHLADTCRYFVMSRPAPAVVEQPEPEVVNEIYQQQRVQRFVEKRRKQIAARAKGEGVDPTLGRRW